MNKFLKVLGTAALIAGFTPYRISGDKETDSLKIEALLWQMSSKPGDGVNKRKIDINFGFPSREEEETHIFTDEVTVKYGANAAEEDAPPEEEAAGEAPEAAGTPVEAAEEEAPEEA